MKKMEELNLGYCGLDCKKCLLFIATANNDFELMERTAKEWSELYAEYIGKNELEVEDYTCKGCRNESDVFIGCSNCEIRSCCLENNFETCADCPEYKKCDTINGFFQIPSHEEAKDNLERIRSLK
jgi:hypothetical protein